MLAVGIDIGSLTAKAVVLEDGAVRCAHVMRVKPRPADSAKAVLAAALAASGARMQDIDACCATGYGRMEIPFATMQVSEISCHALGAHVTDPAIRTVIDIGGQDCKVIALDEQGKVRSFIMNEKCAAGTGRCLEILAKAIGVDLSDLGLLSLKSRRPISITNKCSIFMELEVLQHFYRKARLRDIAAGINLAVARRVAALARSMEVLPEICLTGGVSKNAGVASGLERIMGIRFKPLSTDPQLMGALGASVFAQREAS